MSTNEQICTFSLDGLFLVISVNDVHEVLLYQELTPVPLSNPVVAGLINMRGQIVVAIDLRRVLRLSPRSAEGPPPVNVIVRNGTGLISVLVDEMGDVMEVDSRLLTLPPDTAAPEAQNFFRGAYQLLPQLLLVFDTSRTIEAIVSQATSKLPR